MSQLGQPYQLKGLHLKNKIVMAPMCQYSAEDMDGMPTDWHLVHYVSRAVGGAGLIVMEMTNVEPDGRITDRCLGLWSDEHIPAFARIIREAHKYGTKVGIQIAHAGRKAEDALHPVSSSDQTSTNNKGVSARALTTEETADMVLKYREAARRAIEAGVDTIELHGAHGYLIHQFHSPAINRRTDVYGQDYAKFGCDVITAVRSVMPEDMPLLVRISAIELADGGYDLPHMIQICERYRAAGADMFHVSTGGDGTPGVRMKFSGRAPGYQVPFARAIREALDVPVIAVGNLDSAPLAEATLVHGDADLIAIGRGLLRDPYWAIHALGELGDRPEPLRQYIRAY